MLNVPLDREAQELEIRAIEQIALINGLNVNVRRQRRRLRRILSDPNSNPPFSPSPQKEALDKTDIPKLPLGADGQIPQAIRLPRWILPRSDRQITQRSQGSGSRAKKARNISNKLWSMPLVLFIGQISRKLKI